MTEHPAHAMIAEFWYEVAEITHAVFTSAIGAAVLFRSISAASCLRLGDMTVTAIKQLDFPTLSNNLFILFII